MIKSNLFILFSVLFYFTSCNNQDLDFQEETFQTDEDIFIQENQSNLTNEDIYFNLSGAIYNLQLAFNELEKSDLNSKSNVLISATENVTEMSLTEFSNLHAQIYQIDKSLFKEYFGIIHRHKDIFSSDFFEQEYVSYLENYIPQDNVSTDQATSRWFLAALGELLGASDCTNAVLGLIDTAAYVATGILTAPTGVGAVANTGGAITSYGMAFVNQQNCMYPGDE